MEYATLSMKSISDPLNTRINKQPCEVVYALTWDDVIKRW
jgi:hypothetical protein